MRHSAEAWSGKTSEVPTFRLELQPESVSRFGRQTGISSTAPTTPPR